LAIEGSSHLLALVMSKTETLLQALRDIQEPAAPESVSIWLITANIALLALMGLLLIIRRNRKREGWRREARREIRLAKKLNTQEGIVQLAKLLRKIAILRTDSRGDIQGEDWLKELDLLFSTKWFTTETGRIFGTALYQDNSLSTKDFDLTANKVLNHINALPSKVKHYAEQS
jgi:hypothetical protein